MPEYCLVKHRISTYVIDGDDADHNPYRIPVTGGVTFTPILNKGDSVVVTENGIPTTITLTPIEARITNGEIYHRGEEGVKLFAGGPDTNPERIRYRATFHNLIADGKKVELKNILFEAAPGGELSLAVAQSVPGAPYPGYSASMEAAISEISAVRDSSIDYATTKIGEYRDEALGEADLAIQAAKDANTVPRVTALEVMGGLAPGEPADGQTANLLLQDDTLTHAAVSDFMGDAPVPQLAAPDVKWIETFQPGHGWTNPGTTGSFSADTTNRVMGTQSLKISGGSVRKTIPYLDLTRYHLTLLVRTGEMEATNQMMSVYVSDSLEFSRSRSHAPLIGGEPSPWHRPGEWFLITIPTYEYIQGSTPVDMTNIISVQVRAHSGAEVWVQAIGITPRTDAVVSVSFDDGYDSVIEAARRSMSPRGIRGTSYTITHAVGWQNFMTMDETRELHDIHGWEIQAHTNPFYSHGGDNTEVYAEMREARRWLSRNGFGAGVHFAYGGGMSAPENELVSRKTYQSARTISGNIDTIPPARPHRMRAMTAVGGVNGYGPNFVKSTIDQIKEQGGWLHLVFHRIVEGPSTRAEDCSFEDLETILDHILETGVPVKTVSEALAQVSTVVDVPKVAVFRGLPTLVVDMWRSLEKVSGSGAVLSTGHRVRFQDPGEYRITYTSVSAEGGEKIVREATPGGGEKWLTWADGKITEEITYTAGSNRDIRVRNAPEDIVITVEAI